MSFARLMAEVVGAQVLKNQTFVGPWNEYQRTKEIRVLQEACGHGHNIPDTVLGVLYYSLVYQKQHYDALAEVMALWKGPLPLQGRCLMVDFGAGPGTAALAWAAQVMTQANAPLTLSYVHLDRLASMEPLCGRFLEADPNIGQASCWWAYRTVPNSVDASQWVEEVDYAVFVFSYVLCQPTVNLSVVTEFARLVADTCMLLNGKPAYLLMVDANLPTTSRYYMLMDKLRQRGVMATATSPTPTVDYRAVYLNPDGTIRDSRDNSGRTIYDVIRLQ